MTVLQRAIKAFHNSPMIPPTAFRVPTKDFGPLRRAVKRVCVKNCTQFYGGYGVFMLKGIPVIASKKVRRITLV